jgi:hypothetical protein
MVAQVAEQAAERVERVSGYLREKDIDQLVREAEDFARRQPALFLGGAFALGVLGARFLKSSGKQANQGGGQGKQPEQPGTGYETMAGGYRPAVGASSAPATPAATNYDALAYSVPPAAGVPGSAAAAEAAGAEPPYVAERPAGYPPHPGVR